MMLSCIPVSLFDRIIGGSMSIGQWAALGRELGLDGIDLSVLFLKSMEEDYLSDVSCEIEAAGMGVAVLNTYPDFTQPDTVERRREQELFGMQVRAASALGVDMVRVTAGQNHPGIGREQGMSWAVEGILRGLDEAKLFGVDLVYENHSKPGCWQYPDFSYPGDIFREIASMLEETAVGILFDTANPVSRGEDPLGLLEGIIERVRCVHIADTASARELQPVQIGSGLVPIRKILSRMRSAGYEGWISIEEASHMGRPGIEQAVEYVRRVWDSC